MRDLCDLSFAYSCVEGCEAVFIDSRIVTLFITLCVLHLLSTEEQLLEQLIVLVCFLPTLLTTPTVPPVLVLFHPSRSPLSAHQPPSLFFNISPVFFSFSPALHAPSLLFSLTLLLSSADRQQAGSSAVVIAVVVCVLLLLLLVAGLFFLNKKGKLSCGKKNKKDVASEDMKGGIVVEMKSGEKGNEESGLLNKPNADQC